MPVLKTIDNCVSCDLPCIGRQCPYSERLVEMCDKCLEAEAKYYANECYWCEECITDEIKFLFDCLPLEEQAEAVFHDFHRIGG